MTVESCVSNARILKTNASRWWNDNEMFTYGCKKKGVLLMTKPSIQKDFFFTEHVLYFQFPLDQILDIIRNLLIVLYNVDING